MPEKRRVRTNSGFVLPVDEEGNPVLPEVGEGVFYSDLVVDCFGGIGGTALHAILNGFTWVGVELESRFHGLAQANIELWHTVGQSMVNPGSATILRGDSRNLVKVLTDAKLLSAANVVVSSPPYAETSVAKNSGGVVHGAASGQSFEAFCATQDKHSGDYGSSEGQLSRMPAGQPPSLLVSSPPYAGIATGAGGLNTKPGTDGQQSGRSAAAPSQDTDQRYGSSDGQLAVMREGDVAAVVSSPPFENSLDRGWVSKADRVALARELGISNAEHISPIDMEKIGKRNQEYGNTDGNIGNQGGETFWAAAADIVAQCYQILKPGGHPVADDTKIEFCSCSSRDMVSSKNEQDNLVVDSGVFRGRGEHISNYREARHKAGDERENHYRPERQEAVSGHQGNDGGRGFRAHSIVSTAGKATESSESYLDFCDKSSSGGDSVFGERSSDAVREKKQSDDGLRVSEKDGHGAGCCATESHANEGARDDMGRSGGQMRDRAKGAAQLRDVEGNISKQRVILRNASYGVCDECGKPKSGSGKSLGGVAIFVTKDFVRKGKIVPFGDQWIALCESRGFVLVCRHRAMLVEHYGQQDDLFGEGQKLQTSRKSFFRRMAENKGSPAIDWEDVICVRKPA